MPVTVPQGGQRELIDIQMKPAPSRCMEGRIVTPEGSSKPTLYEIGENDPPLWTVNARISVGPRTPASADGKFRVCDLHPGNYWIKTYQDGDPNGGHGIEYVSIGDKDVSGIVAAPQRFFPIDVSAVWEGKPPDTVESEGLGLTLTSTIGEYGNQSVDFSPKLPRTFNAAVHNHGYALSLRNIPAAGYVKDVTYGGRSILNQVFEPGASAAFDGLRIVLARDGARVSVKAVDKDGNAVADANVVIMPMNVTSEAAMAGGMVTGQTDSFGAWLSAPIAPGKYYVIATPTPVNRSFDTIAKLWRARAAAEVVELGAGATVQANRVPIVIE
jgi:hypothetical protein